MLAEALRVSNCENEIARQDYADRLSLVVGHLLLPGIQNVDRESESASNFRRGHEREHVTRRSYRLRVMNGELALRLPGETGGIPPNTLAATLSCDHCLPHPDRLRARREKEEHARVRSAGALSACAGTDEDLQREKRCFRREWPHR